MKYKLTSGNIKGLSLLFILMLLIVSACSSDDAKEETEKEEPEEVVEAEEQEEEAEDKPEEKPKDEEPATEEIDFAKVINEIEEDTEGEAEVIYESDEKHEHDMDGVNVTMDGYTMIELADFHTNFAIPFDDSTDGGVLIAHYTVENNLDKDVHYQPRFDISYSGATKVFSNNKQLTDDDIQIVSKLGPSNDYELAEGETAEGFATYSFSPETLAEVLDIGTADVEVKPAAEEYDSETYDYKPLIGKQDVFRISLSDDGEEKNQASGEFYEDKATLDDMGTKEMLKEKDDLNETVEIGDSKVTLEGYQFTEFTPNEVEAPRFESFDEGVALLTIKAKIENNEDVAIDGGMLSSKLTVNNGKQYLLDEKFLSPYDATNTNIIESKDSGEWLTTFIMDKEEYEKMWKDKEFIFEVGPMKSEEAKDISKGKTEEIVLPD